MFLSTNYANEPESTDYANEPELLKRKCGRQQDDNRSGCIEMAKGNCPCKERKDCGFLAGYEEGMT